MNRPVRGAMMLLFLVLMVAGCATKYDYTIHKPKVVYQEPSQQALSKSLRKTLGKKYVWAEEGPKAFDCSGLTYYSFGRMNLEIPRVSRDQAKEGVEVPLDALQYGDLVFFDTGEHFTGTVTHVGVYIGDEKFQHASSRNGRVMISSLNDSDYATRLLMARRYLPDEADPVQTPTGWARNNGS
ncbi:C40 family peptidase [Thiocystis violacea]|uniref:C40 family peptidase n=1 Tax=Thiocystis violacea TaxID=13725 RepID=UPI0019043E35|nr:C40 family peptidase [Thiocystis violacea]